MTPSGSERCRAILRVNGDVCDRLENDEWHCGWWYIARCYLRHWRAPIFSHRFLPSERREGGSG